ncbi:hypothetical protein A3Q32_08450 [Alcanivorax sp. KX64203]|nr:hypothetical protein A3Q32_08450 [Alcanivorax sp. KX64203]
MSQTSEGEFASKLAPTGPATKPLWEILCWRSSDLGLRLVGGFVLHQGEGDASEFAGENDQGLGFLQPSLQIAS